MSGDRLRERRRRASECLAMARQARDGSFRALLVDMAWQWIDLAEFDEWDNWERTLRLGTIQTKLGKALQAHYKLPEELPHRMLTLLMQIDASQDGEGEATPASHRASSPPRHDYV
jgi:hypothetical protein